MEFLKNSPKFRVRYGSITELAERPGRYTNVVPVRRVLWHGRTELSEVSGTGMKVVYNSQKLRVRIWKFYRTYRSSGYGYGSSTELSEVPVRVMPGKIPRVSFCVYPTEHNRRNMDLSPINHQFDSWSDTYYLALSGQPGLFF